MSGISLLYLPSDDTNRPVQESISAFRLTNRPPQQRPRGAVVAVVEHDDDDAISALQAALRDFPSDFPDSVGNNSAIVLPGIQSTATDRRGIYRHTFSSILTFQGLDGDSKKYIEGYADSNEMTKDAKCTTTVGTWIRRDAIPTDMGSATIILLLVRPLSKHVRRVADSLEEWFQEQPKFLDEMQSNPLLIYVALYNCFNSYNTMLEQYEKIYRRVARLQEKNAKGIFARTYQCNKCLVSMSYCQQDMLAHKASLNALDALVKTDKLRISQTLQKSVTTLQDNIEVLRSDLDDFQMKLAVLTGRLEATLNLDFNLSGERLNLIVLWFTIITVIFTPLSFVASVFSVVETEAKYFWIALMLTLLVSLVTVMWLYNSVMGVGNSLRRHDLRKMIGNIPYRNKLGFPNTSNSALRASSGQWVEEEYPRRSKRKSSKRESRIHDSDDDSSDSDGPPAPMSIPIPPGVYAEYATGRPAMRPPQFGPARPGPPPMAVHIGGRPPKTRPPPRPRPSGHAPGVTIIDAEPSMPPRMSSSYTGHAYERMSAPEGVYSSGSKKKTSSAKKKKSSQNESSLGTLSYSRRPVTDMPDEVFPADGPDPSDEENGGPSTKKPREKH